MRLYHTNSSLLFSFKLNGFHHNESLVPVAAINGSMPNVLCTLIEVAMGNVLAIDYNDGTIPVCVVKNLVAGPIRGTVL